jgi:hypothetical protein
MLGPVGWAVPKLSDRLDVLVNSRSYFDVSTHPQTFFYIFLIHGP